MIAGCMPDMTVSCLRARLLLSARAAPLCLAVQTRGYKHHRHKRAEAWPNLYTVLGVTPKATQAQIKVAYYKLSKIFHPDLNQGSRVAQERFSAISEAYSVLGNVRLRRRYDRGIFTERDLHSESPEKEATTTTTAGDAETRRGESAQRQRQSHSVYYDAHGRRMFDFDEFFKAHYGEARAREQRERELRRRRQEELRQQQRERGNAPWAIAMGVLGGLLIVTSFIMRRA